MKTKEEYIKREDFETEQEFLSTLASDYGLNLIETTSESNGYPIHLRYALIGFDTFQQAEEIAEHHELQIKTYQKKDGWKLWYRTGNNAHEPYQNSVEDYGDNYNSFESKDTDEFYKEEVKPRLENFADFDSLKKFLKEQEEILDKIYLCDENELVITCLGTYYETIQKKSMSFYHDTHHYAIGLELFD